MGKGLLLTVSLVFLHYVSLASPYVLLCYYLKTSEQRSPNINFHPENIDACLCTHLVYSNVNGPTDFTKWKETDVFQRFNHLKTKNKKLKTLLGFITFACGVRSIAISKESRKDFANSIAKYLRWHKFDGLDLDWKSPERGCKSPEDKRRFTLLVKELMAAFKAEAKKSMKERLLLTAPVSSHINDIKADYDVAKISKYVDFLSVMTLHINSIVDRVTGHNSPLHRGSADKSSHRNIDYILKYWRDQGVAPEKLLVTFPTFGNIYDLSSSQTGIGAPVSKSGKAGPYTVEEGIKAYKEICPFLKGATKQMIEDQKVPYAFKGNEWVGYDDRESFKTKAQWLKDNNFGGATLWTLDLDDYSGTHCNEGVYPLANALKTALGIDNSGCVSSAFMKTPAKVENMLLCRNKADGIYPFPKKKYKFVNCGCSGSHVLTCPSNLKYNNDCRCCVK
ncbi:acidic mammalian chitinase-like [Scyliorhinus canicula]|uniref:acidic mammalian chitinase-like n=1 Tax=Scyliorhinus canicula TaxID=7830 RepID=UPI0018F5DB42|nr:acidic mammalian chitinase-like [Scyliorhinus canicula]